jgi:NAD+ diphosphatase
MFDPVDLPFNRKVLDGCFVLEVPDRDPGGEGVWLMLRNGELLLAEGEEGPVLPAGDVPLPLIRKPPLYIGRWQGRPCRLLMLDGDAQLPDGLFAQSLRSSVDQLDSALQGLGGMAAAISHWEIVSRHCGQCGELLIRLPGEWGKECRNCKSRHFPRIHPCVIGLVVRGDEVLLGRKAEWPAGRYSLIAGFVEFGECLEEAMARETLEEVNIEITNIRYLGSQSWPFPSQLMCGFVADYASGEINLNDHELEDARWFKLDELPNLPPQHSISRYIIDRAAEFISV